MLSTYPTSAFPAAMILSCTGILPSSQEKVRVLDRSDGRDLSAEEEAENISGRVFVRAAADMLHVWFGG